MQFQELTQKKRKQGKIGFEEEETRVTDEIFAHPTIAGMLSHLKSDTTRKNYAYSLSQFFRSANLTADEFLGMNDTEIYNLVISYFRYLEGKDIASRGKTIKFALRKLLRYVGRDLRIRPEDDIEYLYKRSTTDNKHIPTKEEIFKMLEYTSSPRNKAFMICLFQSGLRVGTLNQLKYGMIKDYLFDQDGDRLEEPELPIVIRVSRRRNENRIPSLYDGKASKTVITYYTYLGLESAIALSDYIEWRVIYEDWKPKDEDLVFTSQGYLGRGKSKGFRYYQKRKLEANIINRAVGLAAERVGIPKEKIWAHLFRSSFQRHVDRGSSDPVLSQLLMGHKLGSGMSATHYGDYGDTQEKRETYMQINWSRIITQRFRSLDEKTKGLEQENLMLRQGLEQQMSEINTLKEQLQEIVSGETTKRMAIELFTQIFDTETTKTEELYDENFAMKKKKLTNKIKAAMSELLSED